MVRKGFRAIRYVATHGMQTDCKWIPEEDDVEAGGMARALNASMYLFDAAQTTIAR
jgi:hypothetical protein